jgi:serine/threonine protein kinase
MQDGSDVAVKVIDMAALGDDAMVAGFEEEIAVLSKFRHPNLVVLMGWAREGTRRFLIYEFLSGGDVFQRLAKCRMDVAPFPWHERLAICRNAATGLAHLHNAIPHAFHRDIKSANILLGGGSAKMADFGLSCVAKTRQAKDMQCKFPSGTPGYTCPAYIRTGKVTEGSEVYSFGMVMLEMLLNLMPAGMMNDSLVYPIHEAVRPSEPDAIERCLERADAKARWPQGVAGDVAQLALSCIHPDDNFRPRFNEICRALKAIQERYPPDLQPVYTTYPAEAHSPTLAPAVVTPASASSGSPSGFPAGIDISSQSREGTQDLSSWASAQNKVVSGRPLAPDRIMRQPAPDIVRVNSGPEVVRVSSGNGTIPPARSPSPTAEGYSQPGYGDLSGGLRRSSSPQIAHRLTGEDESVSPPSP